MKTYKFIRKMHSDYERPYLAISENRIEALKLSEAYGSYGQRVGSYNAGDSICILSESAKALANRIAKQNECDYRFIVGDCVNAVDHGDIYDELYEFFKELDHGKDWEDYSLEVEGFTYWDGHNFATVVVTPDEFANYELLEDEVLEKELNDAIENKEYAGESHGRRWFRFEDWAICESAWQNDFEAYSIEKTGG